MSMQESMEKNIWGFLIVLAIVLSVGGLVEIVPLFYLDNVMEHDKAPELVWQRKDGQTLHDWQAGDGVRPYKALELAGRDVYQREGCYLCHSQMVRPLRDEKERYGHYSLATESMYDHPFQWGSKRTGPDIARLGGKYSDDWHRKHLRAPRAVVPESVMPNYPWLKANMVDGSTIQNHMRGMQRLNVPYTDADIEAAAKEVEGKTEEDALVAYLQVLGTMVTLDASKVYRE
ncbi:cytochrome-c oxidase, cbb3-type subunit II [Candidatus Vondammii sp. HM_W22]|uniref:cytochrome-c oxidase, cbb3-type subunit II n=1 Tax=Candidatus Vondammii sp. HM_W22 TaxID=2687299 RepID=UPI001F143413|nr:cytochrome-c oxidase, cbb3-type subunit II [Candidatus Vondammii sp. HM_W22]